jgi:hypothetical protein
LDLNLFYPGGLGAQLTAYDPVLAGLLPALMQQEKLQINPGTAGRWETYWLIHDDSVFFQALRLIILSIHVAHFLHCVYHCYFFCGSAYYSCKDNRKQDCFRRLYSEHQAVSK